MKNSKQDELEIVYLSDEDRLLEQVRKTLTPETTLTLRQWQQLYQLFSMIGVDFEGGKEHSREYHANG